MAILRFWLDGQLGGGEEGVEAEGVMTVFAESVVEDPVQFVDVARNPVGQIAILGLVPDAFHGIEFGRVSRQPFGAEPGAAASEHFANGGAMGREAVTYKEQRSSQVVMHETEEPNDIGGAGIMIEQLVIQAEATRPRSAAERGHRGDAVMPVPGVLHRGLPALGPDASPQGLQQKAAFVDKNQASLSLGALFLIAASARLSSGRFPSRAARGRVAPAFEDSSPNGAATCRHNRDGIRRQTAAESNPAPAEQTSRRAHIPSDANLAAEPRPAAAFAQARASAAGPDEVWPAAFARRRDATLPSSDWRMRYLNQQPQPLAPAISPARKAGLLHIGELPALRAFREVS